MEQNFKYLGKGRPIIEGHEKVTGFTKFAADLNLPNLLHAQLILSPYAHAEILSIDKDDAEALDGVVAVLTWADLPTKDRTATSRNSTILAKDIVQWAGQPVVAIVATSPAIAQDAAELVFIDYEPLDAVAHTLDAIADNAPEVWPNGLPQDDDDMGSLHGASSSGTAVTQTFSYPNVHDENHFIHGDVTTGFEQADIIVENRFTVPALHQAYMEPHACVADPTHISGGMTIYSGSQSKFGVRNEVAKQLGLPKHKVVVSDITVGGGFGAKYGLIEPLTAAIAKAVKQPVKLVYSRSDDFLNTTPAPEMVIDIKVGAKSDGTLTTLAAKLFSNNGVFKIFGHSDLAAKLMSSWYQWQNMQLDTYEIHSHIMPDGAYRAPGAPQAAFAIESCIDDIASQLNIDPLEMRLQNVVTSGSLWSNVPAEGAPKTTFKETITALQHHVAWQHKTCGPNEGIGIAVTGWGTAGGAGEATCRVDDDGTVHVDVGHADISNNNSSFVLVVAEALGVSPDDVYINTHDTTGAYAPHSGGSRVTYAMAGSLEAAATEAKEKLIKTAADRFEAAPEDIELKEGKAQVIGVPKTALPIGKLVEIAREKGGGTGPIVGQGNHAPDRPSPAVSAHLIKVHVDPDTGQVTPLQYVMAQDVGFALNPTLVEGQFHGGMAQGLGMALSEGMQFSEDGQVLTGSFMDYGLPLAAHLPDLETIIVMEPSQDGPYGMRGVGEPPIMGAIAAMGNAIKDAVGVRMTEAPFKAETVWRAMQEPV